MKNVGLESNFYSWTIRPVREIFIEDNENVFKNNLNIDPYKFWRFGDRAASQYIYLGI